MCRCFLGGFSVVFLGWFLVFSEVVEKGCERRRVEEEEVEEEVEFLGGLFESEGE